MSAGKIIAYIFAAILIFFGVLFIWGSFSSQGGGGGWIVIGIISVAIGFGLIWFAGRRPPAGDTTNVTLNIDLPGNVQMDSLKCKSCGGAFNFEGYKDGSWGSGRNLPILRLDLPAYRRTKMVV